MAVLCVAGTASADVYRTKLRGTGVIATYTADDGCIATEGELLVVGTSEGAFAHVLATRTDWCAEGGPASSFYEGGAAVTLAGNGTQAAALTGSVELRAYSGPEDGGFVTVDLALSFTGTGSVTTDTSTFASGGHGVTLDYSSTRQRAARASGSLTIDGDAGSVANAQLLAGVAGSLVVVP